MADRLPVCRRRTILSMVFGCRSAGVLEQPGPDELPGPDEQGALVAVTETGHMLQRTGGRGAGLARRLSSRVARGTVVLWLATLTPVSAASSTVEHTAAGSVESVAKRGERAVTRIDLSGTWDFRTTIPLERPETVAPEPEIEVGKERAIPVWSDYGSAVVGDTRSGLIVDPEDGRLPALVAGIEVEGPSSELPADGFVRLRVGGLGVAGPEERGLSERCLQGFNAGPPITPGHYNQNLRIVQTGDHLALVNEMIHDVRIVRLDAEHLAGDLVHWQGDSIGRWDGDTLVIDTTGFTPKIASFAPNAFTAIGTAEDLHLVERLKLVDPNTLEYTFTIDDPSTFVRPFSAVLLMKRTEARLFEYACHEGNLPLLHILSAARNLETEQVAAGSDPEQ